MSARFGRFAMTSWLKLSDGLYQMQLAHYGGKYSIERMLAFEEYSRTTSLLHVMLVVMSPPIFTAAVLLFQEIVPLQDPTEGWKANWGFWIRAGVLGIANGHEAITQIPPWLNVPSFTTKQIALYSFFTGIGLVAGAMIVAEAWIFPIPFFILTLSTILAAVLIGLMRIIAGGPACRLIASRKEELRQLNNVATLETLMCVGYPLYQVLFTKVNNTPYELPIILMLSVIKLVMKRIFRSAATHEEDAIPKLVIFTVDVFDSFYLATFMQRLAPTTLVVVMVVDVAESLVELRDLQHRTTLLLARINGVPTSEPSRRSHTNVLEAVRMLLRNLDAQQLQLSADCRVRSCISHQQLSTDSQTLLGVLDRSLQARSSTIPDHSERKEHPIAHFSSVLPLPGRIGVEPADSRKNAPATTGVDKPRSRSSATTTAKILQESAEILFTSECIVLTEYVEIIIPIIYGLFILVTVRLPSATYHTEMDGVNVDNVGGMVSRMYLYALLELLSFVALVVVTKRNCGINVLYQLAFVLETGIAYVPSKLVMWILYTLTYRVTHFGTFLSYCLLNPSRPDAKKKV